MKIRNLLFHLVAIICGVGLVLLTASWIIGFHYTDEDNEKDGGQVQSASAYLLSLRSNQLTGTVDMKDVLQAREQVAKLADKATRATALEWVELGPDNFGGRTRALLIDSRDASGMTVYAASVSGGIWKTVNGGQTWDRVNGFEENPNVVCMIQTSNGDIYAGTGEYFVSPDDKISMYSGFIGRGIFLSTDGNNFAVIPSTIPMQSEGTTSLWAYINRLAVDANSGRIYAATSGGLIYTEDSFSTHAFAKTSSGEILDTVATDVDIASNGLVVASVASHCYVSASGNPSGFVDQSTRYYSAPDTIVNDNKLPRDNIARLELAVAPSNGDVIYAMAASGNDAVHQLEFGELEGIYLSEDKGENWMIIGPGGSNSFNVFGNGADYYGFYNNTLAVHPSDPFMILAGGIDMWKGEKVNGTGFYSWGKLSSSLPATYTYIHSSHHIYVYHTANPTVCYIGTDGGIFLTDDDFSSFRAINRQYNTCEFYSVGFDPKGYPIGGAQGNGIIYLNHEGNTPETGAQMGFSDLAMNGGYQEISMIMPNCYILSGQAMNLVRSDDYGKNFSPVFIPVSIINPNAFLTPLILWESFNNQNSRDSVSFIADQNYSANDTLIVHSANNDVPFVYVTPQEISKGTEIRVKDVVSTRFFLAVQSGVYMTTQVLDFTQEPLFYKIASIEGIPLCIASSNDANYVYVGTDGGNVYRIANLALAYNTETADVSSTSCIVSTSLVATYANRSVTSIAVDPNNPEHVVVTLGNYGNTDYVYRSTNALDSLPSFTSIQGNLPKMPVYSSLIELNSSDRIILGTEFGIWSTDNADMNTVWSNENEGMGNVPVFMLRQQRIGQYPIANYGVIYAATFGRGLFQSVNFVGMDELNPEESNPAETLRIYPNPASDQLYISYTLSEQAAVTLEIFDLNGHNVMTIQPSSQVSAGEHLLPLSVNKLGTGTYVLIFKSGNQVKTSKLIIMR
ncbi:MAG: T9SS type A sorting domain-containing protein [Bacteroidales bacterium]|nr:T9SS type A sorting domain-containing protein [Lentimicrobiaceae bacterium]MDD5695822.1 T9SS type A sorting domain-containing protein [Bacteroidales bacterium]